MGAIPRIAFVQDALPFWGGAESVLENALEVFPSAQVYTLVYNREAFRQTSFANREIHTSFIDHLPGAHRFYRAFFPLLPLAVGQLDLHEYDVIVSFSYATAHGISRRPDQLHISYTHTPLRYAWTHSSRSQEEFSPRVSVNHWALQAYFHFFRAWDRRAVTRVDHLVTISNWMANFIEEIYKRPADVLYPPVDIQTFKPVSPRKNYYLVASRLIHHKRIDLAVETFNRLGLPLLVVGEGPEMARLQRMAGPNVTLLGWQTKEKLAELMGQARALVHTCGEEFGIALVEAQAAGCPVITLDHGSAREIVKPGQTGLLYAQQNVESLTQAVAQFESEVNCFDPAVIRRHASEFDRSYFKSGFYQLVIENWQRSRHGS
jgi:glycosyltransferase involved in cell wall biosynthesis